MAKDLNKKPNEAFIEAIRKFDSPIKFEELFAGKYLSEDDLYRNGEIVQMNNEMNNKIQTFFNDTIGEMYKALEEIIGYYITNDMIKNIEEFRKIQDKKNER